MTKHEYSASRASSLSAFQDVAANILHLVSLDPAELQPETAEDLGQHASLFLEKAYRQKTGLGDSLLDDKGFARIITGMINGAGGNLVASVKAPGTIHVTCSRCPFQGWSSQSGILCDMAFGVFRGIANRSFSGADIFVDHLMGQGNDHCSYRIQLGHRNVAPGSDNRLRRQKPALRSCSGETKSPCRSQVVACSPDMQRILHAVNNVAPTSATILITGETGTGKELIARLIHDASSRSKAEFVGVNCGALPESLLESTLFGHERGAFTGATDQRPGLFERATNGTLFLDEVDTLSLFSQTRLLRVLQEGEYERVGGHRILHTDARIISATGHSLREAVEAKRFREDLYFRINIVNIHIPPLRERQEDIPLLVRHIIAKLSKKHQRPEITVDAEMMEELTAYPWPGNVRELENILEQAFLFSTSTMLEHVLPRASDNKRKNTEATVSDTTWRERRRKVLSSEERSFLVAALRCHAGNVQRVAETMGLTPRAVYLKLRKYGIKPSNYRT